jgi:hypothetical protein
MPAFIIIVCVAIFSIIFCQDLVSNPIMQPRTQQFNTRQQLRVNETYCNDLQAPMMIKGLTSTDADAYILRIQLIAALKEFIDEEIVNKWHSKHLKVVPVSGTMIGALRGGMLCDVDLDIAFFDSSNVTHGSFNPDLIQFIANAFESAQICKL